MPKKGYSPEQIIHKLREAEVLLSQGNTIGFTIISSTAAKLFAWDKKFRHEKGWIDEPIDVASSAQFAWFYIAPEHRGKGQGCGSTGTRTGRDGTYICPAGPGSLCGYSLSSHADLP